MKKPDFGFKVKLYREGENYYQHALKYFKKQKNLNKIFWSRFQEKPKLKGAKVLEVGSGLGSLSLDMALSGAEKVVGLDLNPRDIDFAKENLQRNYSDLSSIVDFYQMDLKDYPESNFDYVVSKDTFEHVIDLDKMLLEIKRHLKSGGKLYAEFGPLWNSPFGFHGNINGWNFGNQNPWGHLLITEEKIVDSWNKSQENKISSLYDLGVNKGSLRDYRRIIKNSNFSIDYFKVNSSNKAKSKILSIFRFLPFLEEYLSHNIYCVLRKN